METDSGKGADVDTLETCKTATTKSELLQHQLTALTRLLQLYQDEHDSLLQLDSNIGNLLSTPADDGNLNSADVPPGTALASGLPTSSSQSAAGHANQSSHTQSDMANLAGSVGQGHVLSSNLKKAHDLLQSTKPNLIAESRAEVLKLESIASAVTQQSLEQEGAIACLCSRTARYLMHRTVICFGRSTDSKGEVDIDLSAEHVEQVSRRQGIIQLQDSGAFQVTNIGRQSLYVNGIKVDQFQSVPLVHLSILELGKLHLLFQVNQEAAARAVRRGHRLMM